MTVLVSDNASVDETPELLKTFQDSRLRVIRTPARCSMRANWEYALSHVSDGWVTVIGDDDAILPGAHEMVQKIYAETGVEAIRSLTAFYKWPDKEHLGGLKIPLSRGYSVLKTSRELSRVMSGQKRYTILPMLYNGGFIKVSALWRMALSNGTVFGGSIP
ncbi:MAG: glycosyltransferase, partial [Gemmataceae bacterium]